MILGIYYREVANLNWFLKTLAKVLYGGMPGGSNEDSEEMLLKAVELMPESIEAHLQLAITYQKLKEKEKAISYLRAIKELPVRDHCDFAKKKLAAEFLTKSSKS